MLHPIQSIPERQYGWVFLPLLGLTIISIVVIGVIPQSPSLVQFELAGSVSEVNKILDAWGTVGQIQAAFSLGFGFLAIAAYANTIALACIWAANVNQVNGLLANIGIWLAWGQWLAGLLDIVIDIALAFTLFNSVTPMPQIAQWCAILKFILIFLGLLYAGFSGVVYLLIKK